MNNIWIFSFFSGSGLLDLGFEDSGFEIVFVNEYHKPFLDAYIFSRRKLEYNPPRYGYSYKDIENFLSFEDQKVLKDYIFREKNNKKVVGFIGGPPCPDFSVGGKNRGHHGDNGKLTGVYIELVCSLQPDFVVFENVKGLWRTKRHRAFYEKVKSKLHSAGYITTEQLINSILWSSCYSLQVLF